MRTAERNKCIYPRLILLTIVLVSTLISAPVLGDNPAPRIAPSRSHLAQQGPPEFGFVPPPGDLSHLRAPEPAHLLGFATSYDWRVAGMVTPVKSQGSCGSCYAFASIGNFESRMLIDGAGAYNFSENNVKECEYFGSSCAGGNYWKVANYLAAYGTVLETCDPYVASDVTCNSSCPYQKTLLDWQVVSSSGVPPTNVLKSYLQTYGPLYTAMYAGNYDAWHTEFQTYDGSYTLYYAGPEPPNHAVLIVGWDDNLPHAGGTGAWIVKNSWGTGWGGTWGYGAEGGYFTIAYGSAHMGSYASFLNTWQNYDPNGALLYHDEGGYKAAVGYGNTTAWGLVKFVPEDDMDIERVELWTLDTTTDIDVYIYDDFASGSPWNLLASELNTSFDLAGYHSIELSTPLPVTSGDDIYVAVKITNSGYTYPISFDNAGPVASGYCYLSSNGSFFTEFSSGDVGIRARATLDVGCSAGFDEPVLITVADVPGDDGGYVDLSWQRSNHDDAGSNPSVKRYKVWRRRRETLPPMAMLADNPGGSLIGGPYEHGLTGPAWEVVGTVTAEGLCSYDFTAPTYCDSTGSDTCWTYFCVTAHTQAIGQHYDSNVKRGYSVDNLGMGSGPSGEARPVRPHVAGGSVTLLETPEPNPAQDGITVRFELARADWIELEVFDVTGRQVAVLTDGPRTAGPHVVTWDLESAEGVRPSPGLYFLRLVTSTDVRTVKLALLK
jgi:C1A family cysteine protease